MRKKTKQLFDEIPDEAGDQALDETVHDIKSGEASDINNGGLKDQIEFILKSFGEREGEEEIRKKLELGVQCSVCKQWVDPKKAHRHQGGWIGDECCWDERLRSSE